MGLTVYGGGGKPAEEKTVTAGTSVIEVNPSSGKVMKKVTVNPTPTESKEVTAGTSDITVSPTDGKHFSGVTVHPTPSQEKTVIPTAGGFKVSPDTGKLLSAVFVDGDSDLVGENIKQGVNIFGVDGSFDNSHGAYVWKKCLSGTITVTQVNQNENPTILQLASNDIDLGLLTEKDFYDYSGTVSGDSSFEFFFSENGFGYRGVVTSQYTYDSVNHQLKLGELFSGHYTFPNYEAKIIQGYVVSDKSDAYPDGGTQDGYWYEKVVEGVDLLGLFGLTKMAVDTFTFSTRTECPNKALSHSLGEVPQVALIGSGQRNLQKMSVLGVAIFSEGSNGKSAFAMQYFNNASTNNTSYSSTNISSTEVKITYNNFTYFEAGIEYTLITMA